MKTTKKDFELFKKECRKWIKVFGLKDWEINFEHVPVQSGIGEHIFDSNNRWAYIKLATDWGNTEISSCEVKRTAFHETVELWLGRIRILAKIRYVREDEIDEEIHALVRTLENVIFDG